MNFTDLFNLWDIWQRNRAHQALTPSERAWVKGIQVAWHGAWPIALTTILTGLLTWLQTGTPFSWETLGALAISAFTAFRIAWTQARAKAASANTPEERQLTGLISSVAHGFAQATGESS